MLPLTRFTLTVAGRAGSVSGTVILSPYWATDVAVAARNANVQASTVRRNVAVRLQAVFEYMDISVEIFYMDLGATVAGASSGIAVGADDELPVLAFTHSCFCRQCAEREIGIDASVEGLEIKISGEVAC